MPHITFVVPYKEMADIVESVFADHPRRGEMSHTLIVAKAGEQLFLPELPATDVVVSRGFTAQALSGSTSVPTVELQCTGYDVLIATTKCIRAHGAKVIGVVGIFSMTYGADAIAEVFPDVKIISRTVEDVALLGQVLEELRDQGCQAVLGGRSVSDLARDMGMPCVMLRSGKESIASAIDEALRTVEVYRTEKRRSDSMAAIMNYTMEGIIATDPDGRITMMNQFARALCRAETKNPIGHDIRQYFPDMPFESLTMTDEPLVGEICMVGDAMLVLNVVPLTEHSINTGFVLTFQKGPQIQEMEDKIRKKLNPKGFVAKYRFDNILGDTKAIREVKRLASKFAKSEANILIIGETGSGKEFFAQGIHNASRRRNGPFVAVNCAALPEQLLESELFGYVEGAFTGAAKGGKIGLFELAHNGTIFLDEIGDIAPVLQARLLRVIQEREIIRLGHDRITPIDVRIIAATNRDLYQRVAEGAYRSDLLYRLEVLKLSIPPLRDRAADIQVIAESFFQQEQLRQNSKLVMLDPEALAILQRMPWPGNIRELKNFCERLSVLTEHQIATKDDVLSALGSKANGAPVPIVGQSDAETVPERQRILELLDTHRGSRKAVAAAMGIDTSTLWRKMKRHAIKMQ